MDFVWITPNKNKNIYIKIETIYLGLKEDDFDDNKNNYYTIDTPVLSESVYKEIIQYLNIVNNITTKKSIK